MPLSLLDKLEHQMQDLQENMQRLLKHSEERDKKVDEMYNMYNDSKAVVTFIKYLFAGSIALMGGYMALKKMMLGIY